VGAAGRLARAARFEQGAAPDPLRRAAALAVMTIEDAERLRDMLRLSNADHARLDAYARAVAALRSPTSPLDEAAVRRLAALYGVEALGDALAAIGGEPRPVLSKEGRRAAERFASGAEPAPVFPLRGADLIARGIPAGEEIGRRLAAARDRWLDAGCPLDAASVEQLLDGISAPSF
jgi:hypothetical protein